MKKFVCGAICMICFVLSIGILGGIECGEPLSNAWMLIPIGGVCFVSGGLFSLMD